VLGVGPVRGSCRVQVAARVGGEGSPFPRCLSHQRRRAKYRRLDGNLSSGAFVETVNCQRKKPSVSPSEPTEIVPAPTSAPCHPVGAVEWRMIRGIVGGPLNTRWVAEEAAPPPVSHGWVEAKAAPLKPSVPAHLCKLLLVGLWSVRRVARRQNSPSRFTPPAHSAPAADPAS
jgi:hypothetical protein